MQVKKKHLELDMGKQTGSNFFFPPSTCPPLYPFSSNHILLVNGLTFLSWATGVQGCLPARGQGLQLRSYFIGPLRPAQKPSGGMNVGPGPQPSGSNFGKEYIKGVYCHPAFLTSMRIASCKMPGWVKHKLESKFLGEISITTDMQMTPPLWQKVKRN